MLNYCKNCGQYHADKIISADGTNMICPNCNGKQPLKQIPLLLLASGVGKSTLSIELYKKEKEYIVLDSDILWFDFFNTFQDNYRTYRETWFRLCKNISKLGSQLFYVVVRFQNNLKTV